MKNILVTGAAGFIGFHLCKKLLESNYRVYGIDNLNSYYDVRLKLDRLSELGIDIREEDFLRQREVKTNRFPGFSFKQMDLVDDQAIEAVFAMQQFDIVVNLAAQAGVRYSIDNPKVYVQSNVVGFINILEACRNNKTAHLIYASSSSVYGNNEKVPFLETDNVDHPVSLYAATKKSNELMAHTYSHLYGLKTTGLRFFTVYGPWGRPDMAPFLFTKAILEGNPIKVFNEGNLHRDFTYVDDIVQGIERIVNKNNDIAEKYQLYNIGNNNPVKLLDFLNILERLCDRKAVIQMLPMQPGDVYKTFADISAIQHTYGYIPETSIEEGLKRFVEWYKIYYKK